MPQITLSLNKESIYLDNIKTKEVYKVPIHIMLKLESFRPDTPLYQHTDNTTKHLNSY